MAHYAEIDKDNLVTRVLVVRDDLPMGAIPWLKSRFGGTWIQTSYTGSIRKNFAGVGYSYDLERDAFIPKKPWDSWILDEETCKWIAPIPYPTDGKDYRWDEESGSWVEIVIEETTE